MVLKFCQVVLVTLVCVLWVYRSLDFVGITCLQQLLGPLELLHELFGLLQLRFGAACQ